jgi:hypothetical protein
MDSYCKRYVDLVDCNKLRYLNDRKGYQRDKILLMVQYTHTHSLSLSLSLSLSGTAAQRGLWSPRPRGFLITPNDAPQSVGLLWTSDQLVAETST